MDKKYTATFLTSRTAQALAGNSDARSRGPDIGNTSGIGVALILSIIAQQMDGLSELLGEKPSLTSPGEMEVYNHYVNTP